MEGLARMLNDMARRGYRRARILGSYRRFFRRQQPLYDIIRGDVFMQRLTTAIDADDRQLQLLVRGTTRTYRFTIAVTTCCTYS